MEVLRDSFNRLVEETLTMENPGLIISQSQQQQYDSGNEEDNTEMTTENSTEEVLQKNHNFSQQTENKIVNRHKIRYTATRIKYSPTRIKSRKFLSNILYTGINENGFYNESFILDVYVLFVKNQNLLSLNRKVSDKTKHEIVYMLWRECII